MFFDPLYIIMMLPTIGLMLWAQHRVKSTFTKFSQVPNQHRLTGAQAARLVLDSNGLYDVPVERVPGELSDHYDPRSRTLRLSEPVYGSASTAPIAVFGRLISGAQPHLAKLRKTRPNVAFALERRMQEVMSDTLGYGPLDPLLVPDRLVGLVDRAVGSEDQEPVEAAGEPPVVGHRQDRALEGGQPVLERLR